MAKTSQFHRYNNSKNLAGKLWREEVSTQFCRLGGKAPLLIQELIFPCDKKLKLGFS